MVTMQVHVGGQIVPWMSPWWRRILRQLGLRSHKSWLGDLRRTEAIAALSESVAALDRVNRLVAACGQWIDRDALLGVLEGRRVPAEPHSGRRPPPTTKYRLEVEIYANTSVELARELGFQQSAYVLNSKHHTRDAFHTIGGNSSQRLRHTNPCQTPENYERELSEWGGTS